MDEEHGRTPLGLQQALMRELEALFRDRKFCGQEGKKALRVFKQDMPITQYADEDADTDMAAAPYIIVRMTGTETAGQEAPRTAEMTLVVCTYDGSPKRDGWDDVANILEGIVQRFCESPRLGKYFTLQYPLKTVTQEDDTAPFYFGAAMLRFTIPKMRGEADEIEALV